MFRPAIHFSIEFIASITFFGGFHDIVAEKLFIHVVAIPDYLARPRVCKTSKAFKKDFSRVFSIQKD